MFMVAFGHRKRVGKDTAARFLSSYIRLAKKGSNVQVHGFADKLKSIAHELYFWAGLHPGEFYEDEANTHLRDVILPAIGKSPRRIWIDLGTHVGRAIYWDTWVDYLQYSIFADVCIIKDMRFPNECERIKSLGGFVFKIERDDAPNDSDEADDPLKDYTGWSAVIENNGSLGALNKKIEAIGEMVLNRIEEKVKCAG